MERNQKPVPRIVIICSWDEYFRVVCKPRMQCTGKMNFRLFQTRNELDLILFLSVLCCFFHSLCFLSPVCRWRLDKNLIWFSPCRISLCFSILLSFSLLCSPLVVEAFFCTPSNCSLTLMDPGTEQQANTCLTARVLSNTLAERILLSELFILRSFPGMSQM